MSRRLILTLFLGLLVLPAGASGEAIRRFVLAAGVNNGGVKRELLRYAVSDAENFIQVLEEMGGLDPADGILLRNPDLESFEGGIRDLRQRVEAAERWGGGRLEVLVYYSGHADERGLLIGGARKSYGELRTFLEEIPGEVHIVVLDACASGTITRLKGGQRHQPFLVDESSNMQGYAFLTSSSENEAAQESDHIKASFFTHYLVSGMRGAADVTQDGLVTLTEAYQFAFDETLARTTGTRGGTQHPSRDIKMNGTGDVVMTDLRRTTAGLILGEELNGRFFVRHEDQRLVAELFKPAGRAVELGLEPGRYTVHLEEAPQLLFTSLELKDAEHRKLIREDFEPVGRERTVLRGGTQGGVTVGISENFNLDIEMREGYTFSVGLFFNYQENPFRGVQGAWLVNQAKKEAGSQICGVGNLAQKDLRGWQVSGMVNWTVEALQGGQVAGALNIGRQVRGWQFSGSTNVAKRIHGGQLATAANFAKEITGVQLAPFNAAARVQGWQIGVVNLSGDIDGVSLGVVNYSHTGLFNLGIWRDEIGFNYMTLSSGSRAFYTSFSIGNKMPTEEAILSVGMGLGTHREVGANFLEAELDQYLVVEALDEKVNNLTRLRLNLGHKVDPRLAFFAGVSANWLVAHDDPVLVAPWGEYDLEVVDDEVRFWPGVYAGMRLGR